MKAFKLLRKNACNYLERFVPGAEEVLTKHVFADEEIDEPLAIMGGVWVTRHTEEVMKKELKIFPTEHLDLGGRK